MRPPRARDSRQATYVTQAATPNEAPFVSLSMVAGACRASNRKISIANTSKPISSSASRRLRRSCATKPSPNRKPNAATVRIISISDTKVLLTQSVPLESRQPLTMETMPLIKLRPTPTINWTKVAFAVSYRIRIAQSIVTYVVSAVTSCAVGKIMLS